MIYIQSGYGFILPVLALIIASINAWIIPHIKYVKKIYVIDEYNKKRAAKMAHYAELISGYRRKTFDNRLNYYIELIHVYDIKRLSKLN